MSFNVNSVNGKNKDHKMVDNYIEEQKEIKKSKISSQYKTGEVVADFVAQLYRPKPRRGGFIAQFFGENGPYADTIVGLHLTRFQDVFVKVSVWILKDKNGAVQLRGSDQPPITEFIAKIERPSPSREGQTALFFGKDGEDADAINILSRSEFLDSLVYIRIQLAEEMSNIDDIMTESPEDITEKVHIMTAEERKEFEKKQKHYKECNIILKHQSFFRNREVMSKLIKTEEMADFVRTKKCCCAGINQECATGDHDIQPYHLDFNNYSFVPVCKTHLEKLKNNEDLGLPGIQNDLTTWADLYNNILTVKKLKEKLRLNEDEEIPPSRLRNWAMENDIYKLLPNKYLQMSEKFNY